MRLFKRDRRVRVVDEQGHDINDEHATVLQLVMKYGSNVYGNRREDGTMAYFVEIDGTYVEVGQDD